MHLEADGGVCELTVRHSPTRPIRGAPAAAHVSIPLDR